MGFVGFGFECLSYKLRFGPDQRGMVKTGSIQAQLGAGSGVLVLLVMATARLPWRPGA